MSQIAFLERFRTPFDSTVSHRPGTPAALRGWSDVYRRILGPHPLRILDLGCADGECALLFDALGHHPHGLDLAQERVQRARCTAESRCAAVPFHVGDAGELTFRAQTFDVVHARGLLSALPDCRSALAEWFRVLAPGGRIVVAEPAPVDGPHEALHTAGELRSAGFADVEVHVLSRALRTRGRWYLPLAGGRAARPFVVVGTRI